jgi:hypothetical protein
MGKPPGYPERPLSPIEITQRAGPLCVTFRRPNHIAHCKLRRGMPAYVHGIEVWILTRNLRFFDMPSFRYAKNGAISGKAAGALLVSGETEGAAPAARAHRGIDAPAWLRASLMSVTAGLGGGQISTIFTSGSCRIRFSILKPRARAPAHSNNYLATRDKSARRTSI